MVSDIVAGNEVTTTFAFIAVPPPPLGKSAEAPGLSAVIVGFSRLFDESL